MRIIIIILALLSVTSMYAKDQNKILFKSIANNDITAFKKVVTKIKDVNVVNDAGQSFILLATSANNPEMVSLLIDKGANPNISDYKRDNAYLLAGANGNVEILKLLFEKSKIPVDIKMTNRYGGTALIPACERGHLEAVKYLLSKGVNVNHVNNLGWTGLLEVVILGDDSPKYQEIVKVLLQFNADINIKDRDGNTALDIATKKEFNNIAKILKNHKSA